MKKYPPVDMVMVLFLFGIGFLPILFNSCDNFGRVSGRSFLLDSQESPNSPGNISGHLPEGLAQQKPLVLEIMILIDSPALQIRDYVRVGEPPVQFKIQSGEGELSELGEFSPTELGEVVMLVNDASKITKKLTVHVISEKLSFDFAKGELFALLNDSTVEDLISFHRNASSGVEPVTYIDEKGHVKQGSYGKPRFGFHPVSLQPLGILIEKGSANVIDQSQFNAFMAGSGIGSQDNGDPSPDGGNYATEVSMYNVRPGSSLSIEVPFSRLSVGSYVFSFWARSDVESWATVKMNPVATEKDFKFTTEWRRYSLVGEAMQDQKLRVEFAKTAGEAPYNLHLWGPQIEWGTQVTSFMPTYGDIATRASETLGMKDISWMNPLEGTWVIRWTVPWVDRAHSYIMSISNGSESEAILLYTGDSDHKTKLKVVAGGAVSALAQGEHASVTSYETRTTVIAFGQGETVGYENGDFMGRGIYERPPANLNFLTFGYNGAAGESHLNGYIKSVKYYPGKLSEADLKRLSSQ